ncbi:MAG: CBS domain-containing protein [Betaproteobacteria bacterium]|nr:CBS domain-containing protein [Betaproteobacteria bacterium]
MQTKEILRIKGSVLYTGAPDALLTDALATMVKHDIGSLVVVEGGKLAGMLTFRELLKAIDANKGSIHGLMVRDLMVRDPQTVGPDVDVDDLRRVMLDSHVRYIPVTDGDKLLGVLSFHDVAKARLEEQVFENRMLKGYIRNSRE